MTTPRHDPVLSGFLTRQGRVAEEMNPHSDLVNIIPMNEGVCDRFIIELTCTGLTRLPDGRIEKRNRWAFGVHFPETYLARPVHVSSMLTFLGPTPLWHSNCNGPFICLNIRPGTSLTEIVHALADLVTWRLYSLADPLNEAAAQWARNLEPGVLPVDHRPLRWKAGEATRLADQITVTEVTEGGE